jgi:hypothetical protein
MMNTLQCKKAELLNTTSLALISIAPGVGEGVISGLILLG